MSLKIIINADDLGKNSIVNEAIAEALSSHIISSSTIMANSTTWEEVHRIVDDNPQASFGVHLNLTEGKALTDNDVFHKFNVVDENNCFTKGIRKIKQPSKELLNAVYNEWDAQINKVLNVEKIDVSHFDGHHHIHGDFAFRKILVSLCEKYGIYAVRNRYVSPAYGVRNIVNTLFGTLSVMPCMLDFIQCMKFLGKPFVYMHSVMEMASWQREVKKIAHTPDFFDAYETTCVKLKNGIVYPDGSTIEMMCHPGHPNYMKEYEMIKAHTIDKYLSDYKLISYKELR